MHSRWLTYLLIILSAATLFALHFNGFSSNDFWIQAAVGDYIWQNFALPETALYPFTVASDYPFLVHEWFASVIISLIANWSGDSGIGYALAKLGIASALFSFVFLLLRLRGGNLRLALLLSSVISVFLSFRLTLRAENLAFIYFAAFLFLFHKFIVRQNIWKIVALFLLTLLWANTHGSFVLALVYVAVYLFSMLLDKFRFGTRNSLKPIVFLFLALFIACLINPYGYEIFQSAAHISSSAYMKTFIAEWQPPFSSAFSKTPSFYFYVCYLVISLIFVLKNVRKISNFDRLVYLSFAMLSLLALRHVVYFYLATIPIIITITATYSPVVVKKVTAALAALLVVNFAFVVTVGNYIQVKVGTGFQAPLDLTTIQWLRTQNYTGPVFNSYMLGDQLVYNFFPSMRIVIDSRTDLYGEDYIKRYQQTIYQDDEFLQFLAGNQIKMIVVTNEDFSNYFQRSPKRLELMQSAGWKIGFRSEDNFVLTLGDSSVSSN